VPDEYGRMTVAEFTREKAREMAKNIELFRPAYPTAQCFEGLKKFTEGNTEARAWLETIVFETNHMFASMARESEEAK
jgi:hypothetical protein